MESRYLIYSKAILILSLDSPVINGAVSIPASERIIRLAKINIPIPKVSEKTTIRVSSLFSQNQQTQNGGTG